MISRLRDSLQAKEGSRKWAIPLLVAVVYFAIARLGLFMATLNHAVSPVWPASGFAIFIVSVGGPRYLISIFVGALLTTISNQLAPMVVLGISLGNTFEAFVGAFLLNRMTSDDETDLNFLKDVTAYFVASGLGAAASAVVGTSTLILFGGVDHKVYDSVMWTWWIGDFIGALLILPATRVIARTKSEFKLTTLVPIENRAHMVGVVAVLLFAISVVMFLPIGRHVVPLLFLPVLLGAMFVSPPFGTLLGFLIACASIGFTLSGHSPFRLGTENQNLIHVQLLVAAIMLSSSFVEGVCRAGVIRTTAPVLAMGWFLSGCLYSYLLINKENQEIAVIKSIKAKAEFEFHERVEDYLQIMRSAASLANIKPNMTRLDWKEFNEINSIPERFSGFIGLSMVFAVKPHDLARFESSMRANVGNSFKVRPLPASLSGVPGSRTGVDSDHLVITYMEPQPGNSQVIGVDISSERTRRLAAFAARDSGLPTITDRLKLVQNSVSTDGNLVFYPVYRNGAEVKTIESRRKNFLGVISAPLTFTSFFEKTMGYFKNQIDFTIYEGSRVNSETRLYSTLESKLIEKADVDSTTVIPVGQKFLTVAWHLKSSGYSSGERIMAWSMFVCCMVTLLFASTVASLRLTTLRAQKLADEQTAKVDLGRQKLVMSAKMSSMGEMATGIAHEINNPLAIISAKSQSMVERISKPNPDLVTIKRYAVDVVRMSDRIAQIIKVLRAVSREGSNDPMELISIQQIIDNCIMLCSTKYFANKVELMVTNAPPSLKTECRPVEIEQVLLNSLYNAFDAASKQDDKWVKIDILDQGGFIEVMITDSGAGIPEDIREKKLSAVLHYERSGQRGWARTQRRTGHLSKPQR